MKNCPTCNAQLNDDVVFCPQCGTNLNGGMSAQAVQPVVSPFDHTAEFKAEDISEGKVFAMLPYLLGFIGVFFAAILKKENAYVDFHVREGLKLCVTELLLALAAGILVFTFIVPIAAGVCIVIVFVLQIIAFFQVCSGKAKEPGIVRGLGFLK